MAALEKAKTEKEAHGEFESECPGYCGGQDTTEVAVAVHALNHMLELGHPKSVRIA